MISETFSLTAPGSEPYARFTTYFQDQSRELPFGPRPVVIVVPGGGYQMTSDREAEPVAYRFLAHGFHTLVLRYSVKPAVFPTALLELARTVQYVRRVADRYGIDQNRIVTVGFSAGGHLAACLGNFWQHIDPGADSIDFAQEYGIEDFRPNAQILGYPVITAGPFAEEGSISTIMGLGTGQEVSYPRELFSLEKSVSSLTPPSFLWHTQNDNAVPCENSLLFATALKEKAIPFELHIYPDGPHGLSLADKTSDVHPQMWRPHAAGWIDLACEFIDELKN